MIGTTRTGLPTHERLPDLLASSDDPHPHKTRRIEWVGHRSPFDDERVQANMLLGRYTPTMEEAVRLAAKKAVVRVSRWSVRVMEKDHRYALAPDKQLSQSYCWREENNFIQDVDYRDVDILLGGPSGSEFRDLDARDPEPQVTTLSPEVFKLIATEFMVRRDPDAPVPGHGAQGQGSQTTVVLATH